MPIKILATRDCFIEAILLSVRENAVLYGKGKVCLKEGVVKWKGAPAVPTGNNYI